ncbi:MAG: hypothetical protein GY805_09020, partial [Chloroflexi bacterium]|nr:hypothetical protein [Chloroflexota bacterium]
MDDYISLNIYSLNDWNINNLIQFLGNHLEYDPDKWGPFQPTEFDFNLNDLPDMIYHWENSRGFLLEKKDPQYHIQFLPTIKGKKYIPNWLNMNLNPQYFLSEKNISKFVEFMILLFERCNGLYGYVCHNKSFGQKNRLSRPTMINDKLIATASYPIIKCLPGVYWANFFGNKYVD